MCAELRKRRALIDASGYIWYRWNDTFINEAATCSNFRQFSHAYSSQCAIDFKFSSSFEICSEGKVISSNFYITGRFAHLWCTVSVVVRERFYMKTNCYINCLKKIKFYHFLSQIVKITANYMFQSAYFQYFIEHCVAFYDGIERLEPGSD